MNKIFWLIFGIVCTVASIVGLLVCVNNYTESNMSWLIVVSLALPGFVSLGIIGIIIVIGSITDMIRSKND